MDIRLEIIVVNLALNIRSEPENGLSEAMLISLLSMQVLMAIC